MKNYAIVLAAGKGTRMKTELPKCAYPILKKPMISYIYEALEKSVVDEVIVVVGHKKEVIMDILKDKVMYAEQKEQLGTADACKAAREFVVEDGNTIILPGDMPLVTTELINRAFSAHKERRYDLTICTTKVNDPTGYGRIVRGEEGIVEEIVEQLDANGTQLLINEINTGVYVCDNKLLFEALDKVKNNNAKNEYYLTDIVKILKQDKMIIGSCIIKDSTITMGVNDLYALSIAEAKLRLEINKRHMYNGVAMINPETITIGDNVIIEENVQIHPNTYITGDSIIHKGASIGPNTEIHNSVIGQNVVCRHSLVYDSIVHENTTIGPFAHLREGANIGPKNRIGNFVEVKKSSTKENTKASHLAYIGDTECGANVNFGCGSITVNYDGINKHKTIIGDNVFIGCNVNMIAPIKIENNSFIAAGSTINKDVPGSALAIARAKQVNKVDYIQNLPINKKFVDNK